MSSHNEDPDEPLSARKPKILNFGFVRSTQSLGNLFQQNLSLETTRLEETRHLTALCQEFAPHLSDVFPYLCSSGSSSNSSPSGNSLSSSGHASSVETGLAFQEATRSYTASSEVASVLNEFLQVLTDLEDAQGDLREAIQQHVEQLGSSISKAGGEVAIGKLELGRYQQMATQLKSKEEHIEKRSFSHHPSSPKALMALNKERDAFKQSLLDCAAAALTSTSDLNRAAELRLVDFLSSIMLAFQNFFSKSAVGMDIHIGRLQSSFALLRSEQVSLDQKNKVVKSGYLCKKGSERRNWKKRFFILKLGKLIYYSDEHARDPLGLVSLWGASVSPASPGGDSGKSSRAHSFIIQSGERTFVASAASAEEMALWMTSVLASCISPSSDAQGADTKPDEPSPRPESATKPILDLAFSPPSLESSPFNSHEPSSSSSPSDRLASSSPRPDEHLPISPPSPSVSPAGSDRLPSSTPPPTSPDAADTPAPATAAARSGWTPVALRVKASVKDETPLLAMSRLNSPHVGARTEARTPPELDPSLRDNSDSLASEPSEVIICSLTLSSDSENDSSYDESDEEDEEDLPPPPSDPAPHPGTSSASPASE